MSKQAKIDIILNSEQAKSALKDIQEQLKQVKLLRDKAAAEGDVKGYNQLNAEFKKLNTEARKFEKQAIDVNAILKNLSGSSIREINAAYQQMNNELKNMKRNDPGYAAKQAQVKALKDELNSANGTMGKQNITLKGLMSTIGGWAAGLGIATGAMSAIKAVISATDIVSDKFEQTIGGLKAGISYFSRSLATLDFSNFLTNMGNAITAGREYVSTLDTIGDRTRAVGIIESKDRARLAELLIIRKDVTRTDKERIAAAKEILDIEQNNAERRKSLANDQLDNELNYASKMTGLSKQRIAELLVEQETNRAAIKQANEYNEAVEIQRKANSRASGATMYGQYAAPVISKEALATINNASPAIKKLAGELKSFGKLNEEEYNRISTAYKAVGEANAYFSETTAKTQVGMAKLMKGQLDENESEVKKYTTNVAKEVEKEIGAYAKLVAEIGDLEEQFRNLKASNQPVPNDLVHQIISKRGELKEIEESVKAIGEGIVLMSMKEAGVVIPGIPTQPGAILKKRNIDISTGFPERKEKDFDLGFDKMDSAGKTNYALEQASVIQNAIFEIVKNNQQAALDHKLSILEKEKTAELSNKNLTEAQKAEIEKKYQDKERKLKTEAFQKGKVASIIQAVINTALAITNALTTGGLAAPALAIAAGVTGAAQIAVIAAQKPPEFFEGGYTKKGMNDNNPEGVVHANEFVGSAKAVRNPTIRPIFDIIDYAQRTGTISHINLPAVIASTNTNNGFSKGGYTSNPTIEQINNIKNVEGTSLINVIEKHQRVIDKLIKVVDSIEKNGVRGKWVLYDLEKIQNSKRKLEDSVNM